MRFPYSRPLTIKKPTATENEIGEPVNSYAGSSTVRGEIWPLTANAARGVMGIVDTSTHKAFIETPGLVAINDQLVDGTKTYIVQYRQEWGTHTEAILWEV